MNRDYVTPEEIEKAKEIDLLTYLRRCEPEELVREGSGFRTRSHDSLKISNGLWHWHSRGIGGRTALDYLIHVRGMAFVPAVKRLCAECPPGQSLPASRKEVVTSIFQLPEKNADDMIATAYLLRRGIDFSVMARCLENGTLYESKAHHSAVFVGRDSNGVPRYAMLRATDGSRFKLEAKGSDKRFAFSMKGVGAELMATESAIDALSVATLLKRSGQKWRGYHYLSLGGVSATQKNIPRALEQYLADHPSVKRIHLMLDNDKPGRAAAESIQKMLAERFEVDAQFPTYGKDFNDEAHHMMCAKGVQVKESSR